jgi:GTP-binding protein HflX
VLGEVGAERVPSIEIFNKCDRLDAGERARLSALHAGALCVSALTGDGRDDVVAAMETKLALDTAHVTFEFDPQDAGDRAQIAELYRVGRVSRHVASETGVTVEAVLPRRLLARFQKEDARVRA